MGSAERETPPGLDAEERATARLYADAHSLIEQEHARAWAENVLTAEHLGVAPDFLRGKRVLDAGTGGIGRALRGLWKLGSRDITALDLSEETLAGARRANADIADCVDFRCGNLMALDLPEASFDFVHASGVIHHCADPDRAVANLFRCVAPGGWLYVGLYGKGGLLYTTAAVVRAVGGRIPYAMASRVLTFCFRGMISCDVLDYLYVPHQHHYREAEAIALLERAGFANVRRLRQPAPPTDALWERVKPTSIDPHTAWGRLLVGSGWICLLGQKPSSPDSRFPVNEPPPGADVA